MQDDQHNLTFCIFFDTIERGVVLIGVVLVSHGPLAEGLKGAAEMIVGPQERFLAIGMDPAADVDRLRAQIEAAAAEANDGAGTLVLVDLTGTTIRHIWQLSLPSNSDGRGQLGDFSRLTGFVPEAIQDCARQHSLDRAGNKRGRRYQHAPYAARTGF
ncbi:MAG TPA: hypothetical protein VKB35_00380 [Ktedonobacteraceae bacterium]|nr:hypothetical protein [Ktedonobacteraceae bacterium]